MSALQQVVGPDHVLSDEASLESYSSDETPSGLTVLPEVVVRPESTEQVSKVLTLANERVVPVTPRGRGTGLCNAAVPLYGGIVLSLERMNRILEVDEDNLMAVVEPGVLLQDLKAEVERRGLFYPADPGEKKASIGGNVCTNAGGMNGVKYGNTRRYILGLEAVLPSGRVLTLGGRTLKRSTGYDLMQLLIGSEGTLAVITKVIVKLIKLPEIFATLYVPFNSLGDAARCVSEVLRRRMTPTAMEFVEKDVILEAEKHVGRTMPYHDAEAYLIIRLEGETEQDLEREAEQISAICFRNHAVKVLFAETKEKQDAIWNIRSSFYEAIVKSRVAQIGDAAIPPSRIPEYVRKVKEISREYGIRVLCYGHAGDGNIHVHPLEDRLGDEEWAEKVPKVMESLYREAAALGGTVSGEHGIGYAKKQYLPISVDQEQIRLMREIKRLFDPNNILNPGKIFDMP
ncbi:MAG: FAD-linked oxidase C-terminal domain-containing protein [Candidatus Bathyarchaeia archaeon]